MEPTPAIWNWPLPGAVMVSAGVRHRAGGLARVAAVNGAVVSHGNGAGRKVGKRRRAELADQFRNRSRHHVEALAHLDI